MRVGCAWHGPEWPGVAVPEPLAGWGVSYVVEPPPVEPLTLAEVKLWHHIDQSIEDSVVTKLIKSARQWVEGYLEQSLVTQTREINVRAYFEGMPLPWGPVQEVTAPTEAAPYLVQYVAGYPIVEGSDPIDYVGNIPEPIMTAMQLYIGDMFEHRENMVLGTAPHVVPLAIEYQLAWYRRRLGIA